MGIEKLGTEFLKKLTTQSKSPFGKVAIKESGQALPKGVEVGSPIGDILEGVQRIERLLGENKTLSQSRGEIADFVRNMRADGFSNDAIVDIFKNYGQEYSLKTLRKRIAPQIRLADRAGATTEGQRRFVVNMEENRNLTVPDEWIDKIKERDYVYDLKDALAQDLKKTTKLNEEDISDAVHQIFKSQDVEQGLDHVQSFLDWNKNVDVSNITEGYKKIVSNYVKPQGRRYSDTFATGGRVGLQGGGIPGSIIGALIKLANQIIKTAKSNRRDITDYWVSIIDQIKQAESKGVKFKDLKEVDAYLAQESKAAQRELSKQQKPGVEGVMSVLPGPEDIKYAEGGIIQDKAYEIWKKMHEKNPDVAAMHEKANDYLKRYQQEQQRQNKAGGGLSYLAGY